MRRMLMTLALLLLFPLTARGEWYIRVVGGADSPAAQAEKLRVRDAVLSLCPVSPEGLPEALSDIRKAVEAICPGEVTLRPWAPAGAPARPTLYITLGEGQGHNWWGVLYPDALQMAAEAEETEGEEIVFIWPWWEWLRALFNF